MTAFFADQISRLDSSPASEETLLGILHCKGCDPNASDHLKTPILSSVAQRGWARLLQALVDMGANPDIGLKSSPGFLTPLHKVQNRRCADILLKAGANPNALTTKGSLPLLMAVVDGRADVAETLINVSDISIANENGHSPLSASIAQGWARIVSMLVDAGATGPEHDIGPGVFSMAASISLIPHPSEPVARPLAMSIAMAAGHMPDLNAFQSATINDNRQFVRDMLLAAGTSLPMETLDTACDFQRQMLRHWDCDFEPFMARLVLEDRVMNTKPSPPSACI